MREMSREMILEASVHTSIEVHTAEFEDRFFLGISWDFTKKWIFQILENRLRPIEFFNFFHIGSTVGCPTYIQNQGDSRCLKNGDSC